MTKRIDPEAVPEVFERMGLKPVRGDFVGDIGRRECCLLSALYCDGKPDVGESLAAIASLARDEPPEDMIAEALGFSDGYVGGVMAGWDTPTVTESCIIMNGIAYLDGFRDGKAAREAVERRGVAIGIAVGNSGYVDDGPWDDPEDEPDYEDNWHRDDWDEEGS